MTVAKVSPGQSFRPKAADWNAFADAANAQAGQAGPIANPGAQSWDRPRGVVWVRNDTGSTLVAYQPIKLAEMITAPAVGESTSWTPAVADNMCFVAALSGDGQTAVLQQPLSNGQIGRAVVSGATPVYMSYGSQHAGWLHARFWDGQLQQSVAGEARIVWLDPRWTETSVAGAMGVVVLGAGSDTEPLVDAVFDGTTLLLSTPTRAQVAYEVAAGASATLIIAYYRDDVYSGTYSLARMDTSRITGPSIGHVVDGDVCQVSYSDWAYRAYGNTHIDYALSINPPSRVVTWLARPSALPRRPIPSQLQWNPYTHTVSWRDGAGSVYVPPDTQYTLGIGGDWGATPCVSENRTYLQSLDWYEWNIGTIRTGLDGAVNYWTHDDLPPGYAMVRNKPGA